MQIRPSQFKQIPPPGCPCPHLALCLLWAAVERRWFEISKYNRQSLGSQTKILHPSWHKYDILTLLPDLWDRSCLSCGAAWEGHWVLLSVPHVIVSIAFYHCALSCYCINCFSSLCVIMLLYSLLLLRFYNTRIWAQIPCVNSDVAGLRYSCHLSNFPDHDMVPDCSAPVRMRKKRRRTFPKRSPTGLGSTVHGQSFPVQNCPG